MKDLKGFQGFYLNRFPERLFTKMIETFRQEIVFPTITTVSKTTWPKKQGQRPNLGEKKQRHSLKLTYILRGSGYLVSG